MKRILLFTLLISFIGYSQNPIYPNHPNFKDHLPQELVERMNPFYLEFGDDGMMNFNPSQKLNIKETQSIQSEMMVQNSEYTLRLDRTKYFDLRGKYHEYDYDEFGNLKYYKISFVSEKVTDIDEGIYDENSNLIIQYRKIIENINDHTYVWVNQKNEFLYNDDGYLNNQKIYTQNESDLYTFLSEKTTWNYNEEGNISKVVNYKYSNLINDLFPNNVDDYSYDTQNRLVSVSNTNISNENLKYLSEEYIYNKGNLSQFINYNNGFRSCKMIMVGKSKYTYDENGNLTLLEKYSWDDESQSYVPYIIEESTFDENGNLIQKSIDKLYYGIRIPYSMTVCTYDSFNLKKTEILYMNPIYPQIIHPSTQLIPYYMMVIETFLESETNLVQEGILYHYDNDKNFWIPYTQEEFKSYWYYTKTPSLSTNSVESNSFSIYPNPTSNSLHINSSESLSNPLFELYDIKGSKILSNPFKLTEPIDVSDLQPSMYIYNVKDGSEVKQSGKIIKE